MKKGIWSKYVEYLKDNPQGYWFKRKLYDWGWTPATWQGWLVTFGFVAVIVWNAIRLDLAMNSANDFPLNFLLQTAALIILIIIISYKMGEKPKWQWGFPRDTNNTNNTKHK